MSTSSTILKDKYNNFYAAMRNYVWDFDTVKLLAEIEELCYTSFPDKGKLQGLLNKIKSKFNSLPDEALKDAYHDLVDLLSKSDTFYTKLSIPQEAIV